MDKKENSVKDFAKKIAKKGHIVKAQLNERREELLPEKGPIMERSRAQLATTYAPGSLFTWEGGKGICESVSLQNPYEVKDDNRDQIWLGIQESVTRWLERASTAQSNTVNPSLCVDQEAFLNKENQVEIDRISKFELTKADKIGYLPSPLLYQCRVCSKIVEYKDIGFQIQHGLPTKCDEKSDHISRWNQVDVVFVHWSGGWAPLSPFGYDWSPEKGEYRHSSCRRCGGTDYELNSKGSTFKQWRFVCQSCKEEKEIKQADRLTLNILGPELASNNHDWAEINMLPVSYRASSAYYVQSNRFIKFDDKRVVKLFQPANKQLLLQEIAKIYNFEIDEPSEILMQELLVKAGLSSEWENYKGKMDAYNHLKSSMPKPAEDMLNMANDLKRDWFNRGLISGAEPKSRRLKNNIDESSNWAKKFDPFRHGVEHDALRRALDKNSPLLQGIDVMSPDVELFEKKNDPDELRAYKDKIVKWFSSLGIEKMFLMRKLPICEYSYGYTRVSAQPVYTRTVGNRSIDVPVRLCAFPVFDNEKKRPIYVMDQENEAIYIKLDENLVREWLLVNGVAEIPNAGVKPGISGSYLEQYTDFGPFLDPFKKDDNVRTHERDIPSMMYLLVHSLAHHFIHALAEHSGLDLDGIGEYLFPADCAFIVYRKGMTQDLGNISSMWRNSVDAFFGQLLNTRSLRCSSGSLCDERGGACPGCIMVPEVSCLAANELLSRAALVGGPAAEWEGKSPRPENLVGFFSVVSSVKAK